MDTQLARSAPPRARLSTLLLRTAIAPLLACVLAGCASGGGGVGKAVNRTLESVGLREIDHDERAGIRTGPLRLDLNRKQASVNDEPLPLTAFEYRILEFLMRHHQQVIAKERLIEQLYPDDDERDPNVIEVLVGRLRRKLETAGDLKLIETVRGQGYLFTGQCR